MPAPCEALLLLGGNIGDPKRIMHQAEALIEERAGRMLSRSREHWTEPWGFSDPRLFLNRAVIIDTELAPERLMEALLGIEAELGRKRENTGGYSPRLIDIDILLIGNQLIDAPGLQVPHPRLHERAFALAPAADVAPLWVHPKLNRTVIELLNDLRPPA
ncbi:MAG TPA: 2-amino-4-hydroxy-6-hydroxymethyldihydropteridine diphosphokinase [Flavobacteriales bacterium]|nr:2-amino-4-hydroxy-6-hydroxymethyldihydropteridine diphosphokinase [Flavobacteriales bacterium]